MRGSSDVDREEAPDGSTSPDLSSGGMASTSEGSVGLSGRPGPTTEVGAPGAHHRVPRPAAPVSKSDIHGQRGAAPAMAAKVGGPCGVESRAVVPVYMIAGALEGREKAYVRERLSPPRSFISPVTLAL